jgi:hypothetical protein
MSDETRKKSGGSGNFNRATRGLSWQVPITVERPRLAPPPSQFSELSEDYQIIIGLMVHGLDEAGDIGGRHIEAGVPLTLEEAAKAVGVRLRRAREIAVSEIFMAALNKEVAALRNSERPKNLLVAKQIRDDEGDGSAATKTARLKAIAAIEGRENAGTTVNVQVNNQTAISPGYVIRLDGPETEDEA